MENKDLEVFTTADGIEVTVDENIMATDITEEEEAALGFDIEEIEEDDSIEEVFENDTN